MFVAIGHAASGKSLFAERIVAAWAAEAAVRPTYLATARLLDDGMRRKARDHALRRGTDWDLVEAPDDLHTPAASVRGPVLVDCATMWLTNAVLDGRDWEAGLAAWIDAMAANAHARFGVVTNDVGGGVTPDNALARRFQRAQGAVNQRLAAAAGRVALVTAGLPLWLKG